MNLLLRLVHFALSLLAVAVIYTTAVPLIASDAWWIRVFDFPRLQIAAVGLVTLAGYTVIFLTSRLKSWVYPLVGILAVAVIWQGICMVPYTDLYPKEMADSTAEGNANRISILIFNVLHKNREVAALRELIRTSGPDVILLSEPTQWWFEQLAGLANEYPYTLFQPQENDYGMLLYSRLELRNPEIRFLVDPEVPSFRSGVRLRSGRIVTLYSVHPRPPGLERPEGEEDGEREDSTMRDAELLVVAKEIRKLGDVPAIVAGDFNDVAWSRSTHLFQRIGGMLDPRVGREILNTYDTGNRFNRYPLDHVFASEHFRLVAMRRLPHIGSDHFPVLVTLDCAPRAAADQDEPTPDAGDQEKADKAIKKGKADD